jgi:nitric oxide reductase activation protein
VKKLVIDVDDVEDAGDEAPSPTADIALASFALRNAANVLVIESAAVWAMFIQFQDTLTESLDRLTAFMVKEQAEAREDRQAAFRLLERIAETLERLSPRQVGVVPMMVVGNAEAGPSGVVVGLMRRARTPLFLPSDENTEPSNESYVDEAKGSSSGNEESSTEGNEDMEENAEEEEDEMDVEQTLRD